MTIKKRMVPEEIVVLFEDSNDLDGFVEKMEKEYGLDSDTAEDWFNLIEGARNYYIDV